MPSPIDCVARLADAKARLKTARAEAGTTREVEIIAVTKTHAAQTILPLLAAGHRLFGENRVQEAEAKWPPLREQFDGVRLHLIGPLQTNKVKAALGLFDVIETLDRPRLAAVIADEAAKSGRVPSVFIQINTGEEPQKAGVIPAEADAFITSCVSEFDLPVHGLMCIPPADEPPAPHFALLGKIAARHGLTRLSMGMSHDFEIAAQLGATEVRLGSALFGPRA